jgi:hypothetical protein
MLALLVILTISSSMDFLDLSGYWWTATEYSNSNAYYYFLSNSLENALRGNENKKRGFYVRSIRD